MRFRTSKSAFAAISLLVMMPALSEARQFTLNPQIGLNATHLTTERVNIDAKSHMGYQFGGFVRLGERAFLAPGFFYQRTGSNLTDTQNTSIGAIKDNADISGFWIPVTVGVAAISNPNLTLRFSAGAAATVVTAVKKNSLGLTKDDFKSAIGGALGGVGIDFGVLTIDASYEIGLTRVYKTPLGGNDNDYKTKANVARLTVGIKI